jgi:transcription elongation factor Elf1
MRLSITCARCGAEQHLQRTGHFTDQDYYELWHDFMELERTTRREIAQLQRALTHVRDRIEQLDALIQHLEVPTLEQIELRGAFKV